jgi:dTMP kinase
MAAKIITFEGIDGSGKTTLISGLREHYENAGKLCWQTYEPRSNAVISPDPFITTMHLMADRRAHCELIKKMASTTDIIFIDRFDLSTEAYQGCGDGIDQFLIHALNDVATEGVHIDYRILLDVPVNVAVERIMTRGEKITVDDVVRLERVRAGYARMADFQRVQAIDANQPADEVFRDAVKLIDEVLAQ